VGAAVPKLMCTQHPDSTVKVPTSEEVEEAVASHTLYGCDEVMVDFEGKLTPYAQPKDIVVKAYEAGIEVGEEFFVTPRVPNPVLEDLDRCMLALEASVLANYRSWLVAEKQAVKWVVLPMVSEPKTALFVQRVLKKKFELFREELRADVGEIQLVPLVEDAAAHLSIEEVVLGFFEQLEKEGEREAPARVFLGISDSAVRHGHVASAAAIRLALAKLKKLEEERGFRISPIFGSGVPPFRGAMNCPELVATVAKRYAGYETVTVQSAVRYDMPLTAYEKVKTALLEELGKRPEKLEVGEDEALQVVNEASSSYREVVSKHVEKVEKVAAVIPTTRERVPWSVYGRILDGPEGKLFRVPRAIVYTAAWYTLGFPPLLLDAGYLLKAIRQELFDSVVLKLVPGLVEELAYDAKYFCPQAAREHLGESTVKLAEELLDYLGIGERASEPYASMLKRACEHEQYASALGKLRGFLG